MGVDLHAELTLSHTHYDFVGIWRSLFLLQFIHHPRLSESLHANVANASCLLCRMLQAFVLFFSVVGWMAIIVLDRCSLVLDFSCNDFQNSFFSPSIYLVIIILKNYLYFLVRWCLLLIIAKIITASLIWYESRLNNIEEETHFELPASVSILQHP